MDEPTTPDTKHAMTGKNFGVDPETGAELVIVAIGASAGGLDALKRFIGGLVTPLPVVYLICQHLSRRRDSLLAELLGRTTKLPVRYPDESSELSADTIWVVPPNHDAEFIDGRLVLNTPKPDTAPHPSIDRLFKSLAKCCGDRTIGVLLSGTGNDGTEGLRAIIDAGGVGLAQDPGSAQYDAMPQAAIDAKAVEAVRAPEDMGTLIQDLCALPGVLEHPVPQETLDESLLQRFAEPIRKASRIDIGNYKRATIMRRIFKRMATLKLVSVDEYVTKVNSDPEEALALSAELRVGVTSFFRDPSAFDALRNHLKTVIARLDTTESLRIWVPGCSTGQEAYTIALIVAELMSERIDPPGWTLFASDIGRDAINTARMGVYPLEEYDSIPPGLRHKYVEREDDRIIINRDIRQRMIFAVHDLLADPPFSRVHLVSCRNLLIYLRSPAQRQALSALHYALQPGGTLMLGVSETPESFRELFGALDKRARLFERTSHPTQFKLPRASTSPLAPTPRRGTTALAAAGGRTTPESRTRDLLSGLYAPPSLIIDESDRIVHFIGELSPFVNLPRGPADWLVSELVREPIAIEIRSLIHRCRRNQHSSREARGDKYTMDIGGTTMHVTPVVRTVDDQDPPLLALSFEMFPADPRLQPGPHDSGTIVQELERELSNTREHLQAVIEEVETSNEELQTLNEELQSANEELLSTNEELQTSNEEMQSANEELVTVNEELAEKSAELEVSRADLWNIKESLDFALVVVNHSQTITQFNEELFKIADPQSAALGAPLVSLRWRVPISGLSDDVQDVVRGESSRSRTIDAGNGVFYQLNVLQYQSGVARPLGAIITIKDVSQDTANQNLLRKREALYRVILESSGSGMCLLDPKLTIQESNPALAELMHVGRDELAGRDFLAFFEDEDKDVAERAIRALASPHAGHQQFEARVKNPHGGSSWMEVTAAPVHGDGDGKGEIVLQMQDVSQRRQKRQQLIDEHTQLRVLHTLMRRVADTADTDDIWDQVGRQLPSVYDDCGVLIYRRSAGSRFDLLKAELPSGWPGPADNFLDFTGAQRYLSSLHKQQIAVVGDIERGDWPIAVTEPLMSGGICSWIDVVVTNGQEVDTLIRITSREPREWSTFDHELLQGIADTASIALRDRAAVEQRERTLADLRLQSGRMQTTLELVNDAIITTDVDGRVDHLNGAAERLTGYPLDKARGRAVFNVVTLRDAASGEAIANPIEQALREQAAVSRPSDTAVCLVNAAGTTVPVDYKAAPIRAPEGDIIGGMIALQPARST